MRLVSKENEYSWISRIKFELRFLHRDERVGLVRVQTLIIKVLLSRDKP